MALLRVWLLAVVFACIVLQSATKQSYEFIPRSAGTGLMYEPSDDFSERCRYPPAVGTSVPAFLFTPAEHMTIAGAVIILHECVGVQEYVLTVARALAGAGFVAAVPNLFRESVPAMSPTDCRYVSEEAMNAESTECMWKMQHLNWPAAVEDVLATAKHLHKAYKPPGVATWGFSMGGALSLLVASQGFLQISASIAFYGYPDNETATGAGRLFDPRAVKVPVLFEAGSMDPFEGFSAPSMTTVVKERLSNTMVTSLVQDKCGHSFMNDAPWWHLDGGQHANETCRRHGFVSALDFLAAHFGVQPSSHELPPVLVTCEGIAVSEVRTSLDSRVARDFVVTDAAGCGLIGLTVGALGCMALRKIWTSEHSAPMLDEYNQFSNA